MMKNELTTEPKRWTVIIRRNLVSPQLAKPSYQLLLQGESLQTSLLYIQIDKYENSKNVKLWRYD